MLIRSKPNWELPERIVTPEHLVMNRRGVLKTAGILAAAGAWKNLTSRKKPPVIKKIKDNKMPAMPAK